MTKNASITDTSTNYSTPTTTTEEYNSSTWKTTETTKTRVWSSTTPTQSQPVSKDHSNIILNDHIFIFYKTNFLTLIRSKVKNKILIHRYKNWNCCFCHCPTVNWSYSSGGVSLQKAKGG